MTSGHPTIYTTLTDVTNKYRSMIETHLEKYATGSEPTTVGKELSRRAHALEALDLFANIDFVAGLASQHLSDEEEIRWLTELVAEIAYSAFEAGRHTQAAWGKEFEQHASVRLKYINALNDHNPGRDEANKRRSERAKEKHAHAKRVWTCHGIVPLL